MIPVGYIAKIIAKRPDWVTAQATDIYSVSNCVSKDFADYIKWWKHNGYWFFDAPGVIGQLAEENGIDTSSMKWFSYEVYEKQYDDEGRSWTDFQPESSFSTNVKLSEKKKLEGYDVVSFSLQNSPECSPLSCNNLAQFIPVNAHCLLENLEAARMQLESGGFDESEPGPFRIFAVYSLPDISLVHSK
jgi:hypothetical protein